MRGPGAGRIGHVLKTGRAALAIALALVACDAGDGARGRPPDPDPAPAAAPEEGVTVRGRVVAEETRVPIRGAYVIVLEPGVDYRAWEAADSSATGSLIEAATLSDDAGVWTIDRLDRGADYTVVIAARGYRSAVFEDGLSVRSDDPDTTRISDVALEEEIR